MRCSYKELVKKWFRGFFKEIFLIISASLILKKKYQREQISYPIKYNERSCMVLRIYINLEKIFIFFCKHRKYIFSHICGIKKGNKCLFWVLQDKCI